MFTCKKYNLLIYIAFVLEMLYLQHIRLIFPYFYFKLDDQIILFCWSVYERALWVITPSSTAIGPECTLFLLLLILYFFWRFIPGFLSLFVVGMQILIQIQFLIRPHTATNTSTSNRFLLLTFLFNNRLVKMVLSFLICCSFIVQFRLTIWLVEGDWVIGFVDMEGLLM